MFCPSCGQPVAQAAKFCPACGATLVAAPAPSALAAPPPASEAPFMPAPGVGPAPAARYGGFWRRFWGLAVDRILLGIVLFPLGMMFGLQFLAWPGNWESEEFIFERLGALIFGSLTMWFIRTLADWLYAALFQSSPKQATLGQMLLGVKVTDLEGRRISFGRATGRHFAAILSGLILGIGYLICAFHDRKQTLHDMIAGTLVVRS